MLRIRGRGPWRSASPHRWRGLTRFGLPTVTKMPRVGLTTYGPGPYQHCNVRLDLPPTPNSASITMGIVNGLTPASPGRHSPRRCNRRPRGSTTNTSLGSSSWSPTAKRPAGLISPPRPRRIWSKRWIRRWAARGHTEAGSDVARVMGRQSPRFLSRQHSQGHPKL